MKKLLLFIGTFLLSSSLSLATNDAISFPDVDQSHQYYNSIMYMASEKVVNGYPDGTFRPDNPINRAEMMKILVEALIDDAMTSEYADDTCFPDVPGDQWFTKHVCYGKNFSWVKGYTDNTFRPSQTITFAEALKITFKGFNLPYTETTEPWYNDAVIYAEVNNYIPYSIMNYEQPLTRGEMSDLVSRIKIGTTLGEQALYNFTIYGMEALIPGDTGNPDDPTSYINTGYFNYYDLYLPFDPNSADNYIGAQDCPAGTNVYRNELYKYEFCYDPTKVQLGTDFDYLITFFFEEGGLVEDYGVPQGYAVFFSNFGMSLEDFAALLESLGAEIAFEDFSNPHGLNGLRLTEGEEILFTNLLLFENQEMDSIVEILYLVEGENIENAMQLIQDTFRYYTETSDNNEDTTELHENADIPIGDNELLGYWESACLVPDPQSDWAERHSFEIDSQYAIHTIEEWYAPNCNGSGTTTIIEYSYEIPTKREINLTNTISGTVIYDIYEVSDGTLLLGHGFRNNLPYPDSVGLSEEDRISTLNDYIIYQK